MAIDKDIDKAAQTRNNARRRQGYHRLALSQATDDLWRAERDYHHAVVKAQRRSAAITELFGYNRNESRDINGKR